MTLYDLDQFVVDHDNKTINGQSPKDFFDYYYDGKEDYHIEEETNFVQGLGVQPNDNYEYIYKGVSYDQPFNVIYSDDDLIISYFECLNSDGNG